MSDHILTFWQSQAAQFGGSHAASWGDNFAIQLEIDLIGQYIKAGDHVLDVGCANGYSLLHQVKKGVASATGIDFSEKMIQEAHKNKAAIGNPSHIEFKVGDVRKLSVQPRHYDVVYTTRTLINLPTWAEQKRGIAECIQACKPGGTVVFSEAFWEPLVLLNALRALKSLQPLVEHDFNRYLKKKSLEEHLTSLGLKFEAIDFSSIYYLGSRFVRDLVTKIEDYPGYSNPINELFYKIEREFSGGGFGIQQAYVVRV